MQPIAFIGKPSEFSGKWFNLLHPFRGLFLRLNNRSNNIFHPLCLQTNFRNSSFKCFCVQVSDLSVISKCFVPGANENNCSTFFECGISAVLSKIKQRCVIHKVSINGSTKFVIKEDNALIAFLEFRVF